MVHTVCPCGQHVYICALMRECQAGCCSASSCCLHLSSWHQVFVSSWQHLVQQVVTAVAYQTDIPTKPMRFMFSTLAADVNDFASNLYTDAGKSESSCQERMRCDRLIQQRFGAHSFCCFGLWDFRVCDLHAFSWLTYTSFTSHTKAATC